MTTGHGGGVESVATTETAAVEGTTTPLCTTVGDNEVSAPTSMAGSAIVSIGGSSGMMMTGNSATTLATGGRSTNIGGWRWRHQRRWLAAATPTSAAGGSATTLAAGGSTTGGRSAGEMAGMGSGSGSGSTGNAGHNDPTASGPDRSTGSPDQGNHSPLSLVKAR